MKKRVMLRDGRTDADVRDLQLAPGVYVVIFEAKLAVYFLTGVMVLLAEALHTLSDIFVSGFLLVAALANRQAHGLKLPTLIGPDKQLAGVLKEIHETIGTIGYYLISLHAAAAFYHHYLMDDDTLRQMLPRGWSV